MKLPRYCHCRTRAARGAVLLLVVLSVGIALVSGATFLASSSATTRMTHLVGEHAQSRQIAESGLSMATAYIDRHPDWRAAQPTGAWILDHELFGGTLTVHAAFDTLDDSSDAPIADFSFESQIASLATPLLNPPMAGVIGGWSVQRTALLQTGLTVPVVGVVASADSTHGGNQAVIQFGASVTGSGLFRQTLLEQLLPDHRYSFSVDVKRSGFLSLDHRIGFRVRAGGTLIATTQEALLLQDALSLDSIQSQAEQLLAQASEPATLVESLLSGSFSTYTLVFVTDQAPVTGPVEIELFAESTGLIASVAFDNVRLHVQPEGPLELTAVGRFGDASHRVGASVRIDLGGKGRVMQWNEE